MIIIVTGTPGTGKTTFSRALSKELDNCVTYSSSYLLKKYGAIEPDPSGRLTHIININILRKLSKKLIIKSQKGLCIIIETIYPDLWLEYEPFQLEIPVIILLRTDPRILLKRLIKRKWIKYKIIENIEAEFINIIGHNILNYNDFIIEIDTTHNNNLIDIFLNKLKKWDTGIKIDWTKNTEIEKIIIKLTSQLDMDKYRLGV